jgi:hypothetical protein
MCLLAFNKVCKKRLENGTDLAGLFVQIKLFVSKKELLHEFVIIIHEMVP